MAEIFDLNYLLEQEQAPTTGPRITLLGKTYHCRNVDVMEDFLVFVATVGELMKRPVAEVTDGDEEAKAAAFVEVSERYVALRDQLHGLIQALVPDLPREVLMEHFATVRASRRLFDAVIEVITESASEGLKKNADGGGTRRGRSRRGVKSSGSMTGSNLSDGTAGTGE